MPSTRTPVERDPVTSIFDSRRRRQISVLSLAAVGALAGQAGSASAATTGWNQTTAGPFDYNTPGNWVSNNINGLWDVSLPITASQTVTFGADTVLSTGLTFNYVTSPVNQAFTVTLQGTGGDRTITLGGDVSVNPGTTAHPPINIGSATAGQNLNVNLGGVSRTFTVAASKTLNVLNTVSNGTVVKAASNNGTLVFSGANTYAGGTTVNAGVLRATDGVGLPTAGNLTLNGGTWEQGINFTRTIGTGAGEVHLPGGISGFSAFGAPVNVSLNGGAQLTWGGASFNPSSLVINAATANATLNFQNNINLNGGSRSFTVASVAAQPGTITGVISNGSISKTGTGTLILTGANTFDSAVSIGQGAISVNAIGNWSPTNVTPMPLGIPTSAASGQINIGPTNTPQLIYTGSGETTNRIINATGSGGGAGITSNSTGPLVITSNLGFTGSSGTKSFQLNGTSNIAHANFFSTTANTFAGVIGDLNAANPTSLSIGGNWRLSGANTFSGTVSIGANPIVTSFNNDATGTQASSSSFGVPAGGVNAVTNGTIVIASGNGDGGITYIGGGETTNRVIQLAPSNSGGAGAIFIVNDGSGALNFTSNFKSTSVTGGTSHPLFLQGSNGGTISGTLTNGFGGSMPVTKQGGGTWTLDGVNGASTYNGATVVNGGGLVLDLSNNPTGVISAATSSLSVTGGKLTIKGRNTGTSSQNITNGALLISSSGTNPGTSSIVIHSNGGAGTTFTIGASAAVDTWTRVGGTTMNIDLSSGNATLSAQPIASVATPVATSPVLGYATVKDATGTGFAIVQNDTVVRYTAADPLANNSNSATTNFTVSGSLNMTNASRSLNTLSINASSPGTLDLGGATNVLTLASQGLLLTGSSAYTIQNGQVGVNAAELIVHHHGIGALTIAGTIAGTNAASRLTKSGDGTLILTGNNVFPGPTNINGGVLEAAVMANIGSTTANANSGNILNFNGGTLKFGATGFDFSSGFSNARQVNIYDNGATIDTNGVANTTIANSIGGGSLTSSFVNNNRGGFTKKGAGTLTLNGINIYAGPTNVEAGTLLVNGGFAMPAQKTGTWSTGSTSVVLNDSTGVVIGQPLFSTNLQPGTVVTGISGNTITINLAATGAGAAAGVGFAGGSATGVGNVVNVTGGTLGGSGTIAGLVKVGTASVAPGNSAGTLSIQNGLNLTGGSTLDFELNGANTTVGGGINDLIDDVIALTLDGTLNVSALGSFAGVSPGDEWRLINYSPNLLTNNGLILGSMPALSGGMTFAVDTSTPGEVNLVVQAAIPEPAMFGILGGIGMFGLASRRRRRPDERAVAQCT